MCSQFNPELCKAYLKMAMNRAKLTKNRLQNNQKVLRREIADLLEEGKEERAKVRAEQYFQNQQHESALDLLETMCDRLVTRMSLIHSERECPSDVLPTIHSVLFCELRTDIKELSVIRKQFESKYGDAWTRSGTLNDNLKVDSKLASFLSDVPPDELQIDRVLYAVSQDFKLSWISAASANQNNSSRTEKESTSASLHCSPLRSTVYNGRDYLPEDLPPVPNHPIALNDSQNLMQRIKNLRE